MVPPLGVEADRNELCLHLPSEMEQLAPLQEHLSGFLSCANLSELELQKLNLSVRELVANAIEWGHHNQPDRRVTVVCRLEAERVLIVVRDTGPGFDRDNLPHAACLEDPCRHLAVRSALAMREG